MIDLAESPFWLAAGCGVGALSVFRSVRARSAIFGLINAGFVATVGSWWLPLALWACCLILALALRCRKSAPAWLAAAVTGWSVLFLFYKGRVYFHNLPHPAATLINALLAVSYSYVFLRIVSLVRTVEPESAPTPLTIFNYLFPFHMLAAGPIQSWTDFTTNADTGPPPSFALVWSGLERVVNGLFKKYVLAWLVVQLFASGWRNEVWWYRVLEANANYVWLYLDFSAYSDIAIGLGILMGRPAPENFRSPMKARNLVEFWERWHITLSLFIRENLFYPMQMALLRRFGASRQTLFAAISTFVAFLICGFWHAFSWRYLLWGLLQGGGMAFYFFWRHYWQKRLGMAGWRAWQASPWSLIGGRLITFELVALSLYQVNEAWNPSW